MTQDYKSALRISYQRIRKNLQPSFQKRCSEQVCRHVNALKLYQHAQHIAFYFSAKGEIDLHALWQCAQLHKKTCYFPRINNDLSLSFLPATQDTRLRKNQFGILEPDLDSSYVKPVQLLDLILMPLVAFDEFGTRLGMGSGYYDRTLANIRTTLVGVGYDFQKQLFIKPEPWDIPLDAIVTERQIYWSKK